MHDSHFAHLQISLHVCVCVCSERDGSVCVFAYVEKGGGGISPVYPEAELIQRCCCWHASRTVLV